MHTMYDYIKETEKVVLKNIETDLSLNLSKKILEEGYKSIWIIASGSSYNSAMIARPIMMNSLKSEVKVIHSGSFLSHDNLLDSTICPIVISQTGESINSINVLDKIHSLGFKSYALTGDLDSTFAKNASYSFDYGVGTETVGYVTKGVTTLVLYLVMLSINVAEEYQFVEETYKKEMLNDIVMVMDSYSDVINLSENFFKNNVKKITGSSVFYFVGTGVTNGIALEGALKFGETVHFPSFAYETEEFVHGPNLQLKPNYCVLLFVDSLETQNRYKELYEASHVVTDATFLIDFTTYLKGNKVKNSEILVFLYLPFVQMLAHLTSTYLTSTQHPLAKEMEVMSSSKTKKHIEKKENF